LANSKSAALSVLTKLLNGIGCRPRGVIFCLLKGLFKVIENFYIAFRTFNMKHYFGLHLFAFVYAIIGVPFQITVFPKFPSVFHQLLAIFGILVPVLSSEVFRKSVADVNPFVYLKTLKLTERVYNIFWILFGAFLLSSSLLALSLYLPNAIIIVLSLGLFALIVELILGFSLLEVSLLTFQLPLIFVKEEKLDYFRINAKAYFSVIAGGNDLQKDISNFKLGIDSVNDYLKVKFKLGLLKFQDYCNFFKVTAFSRNEEEKDRIRNSLGNFAVKLKNELDLTDSLLAIGDIMGKQVLSFEDILKEVEFDVGFRKTISKNKELITFLLALIVGILTAIQVIPIVWNALHPVQSPSVSTVFMILFL
jgi:hypothetical protein